jgi:hypothetical protein
MLLLLLSQAFNGFAQNVYISPSGNDASGDGTPGNPYQTITHGVTVAAAGNTIILGNGVYDELVIINKSLTIDGQNASQATVTYTGTISNYSTTTPALFKVTAQHVTIRNINFIVNQNIVHSAIHTSGNASFLQIYDNVITASGTAPFIPLITGLAYGRRNAIGINPNFSVGGYTHYNTGLTDITIARNVITGSTAVQNGFMNAAFRGGIAADKVSGLVIGGSVADKNTIKTINHDVIVRLFTNGDVTIRNNDFNGGGVEMSVTNNTTGTIMVEGNNFDFNDAIVPAFALLRMQTGDANKTTIIRENNFTNHNWFVSMENYSGALIDGNIFTPVVKDPGTPVNNKFRLITVNTKVLISSAATRLPVSATFINNVFNGLASADGKGISFYNHDATTSVFNLFTIGQPGSENAFNPGITNYVYVDNINGAAANSLPTFPEYTGTFASNTAFWATDALAIDNRFDVGGAVLLRPDEMTVAEQAILDGHIADQLDDANTGKVILYNLVLASAPAGFSAISTTHGALLKWFAAASNSNDRFDVEKSTDGKNFTTIATLSGKTLQPVNGCYSYTDKTFTGTVYYRLLQSGDGNTQASRVVKVSSPAAASPVFTAWPNPTKDIIYVHGNTVKNAVTTCTLFDAQGNLLYTVSGTGVTLFPVDMTRLPTGIYIIRASSGGKNQSLQVIKQ